MSGLKTGSTGFYKKDRVMDDFPDPPDGMSFEGFMIKWVFACTIVFVAASLCIWERIQFYEGGEVPFWLHPINGAVGLACGFAAVIGWAKFRGRI